MQLFYHLRKGVNYTWHENAGRFEARLLLLSPIWYPWQLKFSDAGIQDISTSISINVTIQKNLNDLTERCEDDQSDKHLEARDRRYSCLISNYQKTRFILWQNQNVSFLLKLTQKCKPVTLCSRWKNKAIRHLELVSSVKVWIAIVAVNFWGICCAKGICHFCRENKLSKQ